MKRASRPWINRRTGGVEEAPPGDRGVEDANRRFLLYGVLPLWVVPGLADWWMHKRTRIEETSGVRESAVHALMMTEVGIPVTLGLLARINPRVLSVMGGAAIAHGATALYDVHLAVQDRQVKPIEQHLHSFLEVLPLAALSFTACLHPDQVRSLLRGGPEPDAWKLKPKKHPLSVGYLTGLAAVIGTGVILPYADEMLRCLRTRSERDSR